MKTIRNFSIIIFCLIAIFIASSRTYAQVTVEITARIAPPPIPFYTQPPCPVDDYLWTPGYWAWSDDGYYWVPGVWVRPPRYGFYWTPCYWGFSGGYYGFHPGYWGPHIGYYGGVNYGCGYYGSGFHGGRWEGEHFQYNTAVVSVDRRNVHRTYVERVNNTNTSRVSYNGPGGANARPNRQEETYMREKHAPQTTEQNSHQQGARRDRGQFASANQGRPATASMNKVGGQGYNPRGQNASAQPTSERRPQSNNESSRRERTVNTPNNAHAAPQSQQHNASSPSDNRRSQPANQPNNNSRRAQPTSQPSPQHNASPSNGGRQQQTHTMNQQQNNNRRAQPQQQNANQPAHSMNQQNNNSRREQPASHPSPQPAAQHNAGPSNGGRQQQTQQHKATQQPSQEKHGERR